MRDPAFPYATAIVTAPPGTIRLGTREEGTIRLHGISSSALQRVSDDGWYCQKAHSSELQKRPRGCRGLRSGFIDYKGILNLSGTLMHHSNGNAGHDSVLCADTCVPAKAAESPNKLIASASPPPGTPLKRSTNSSDSFSFRGSVGS